VRWSFSIACESLRTRVDGVLMFSGGVKGAGGEVGFVRGKKVGSGWLEGGVGKSLVGDERLNGP